MEKPYEIGISRDGTYVYAHSFRVPYSPNLALTLADEFIRLGNEHGVIKCFVDIRGTTSVSSVTDQYVFAHKKAPATGLPRHWKYAFLKDKGDDSLHFIEIAMQNAGYEFKVFENESEAIDWLKGTQST
jgi:hypothetical protein